MVTWSLKCAVFQVFGFKNAVTLKIGLGVHQGHYVIKRNSLPIDLLQ